MEQFIYSGQKKLRCGFTSGTCATVAAKAAVAHLLHDDIVEEMLITLPIGEDVVLKVLFVEAGENYSHFMVVKDAGDDPDVTNGAEIHSKVSIVEDFPEYTFIRGNLGIKGGFGVGTVTKEGLEQSINYAAINKVPREMIFSEVSKVLKDTSFEGKLLIEVSVPLGEELAEKTFNPKLGIIGGISILGTSGIVRPMSEDAIVRTIETEMTQWRKLGNANLLICPGNYGEKYIQEQLNLKNPHIITCSNYIGQTLDMAQNLEFENVLLVGNIGKLCKLSAGIFNTHSKVADGRKEVFITSAALCGANLQVLQKLEKAVTTEEMLKILNEVDLMNLVLSKMTEDIYNHVARRIKMPFGVILFSEVFGRIGETKDTTKVLEVFE